MATGYDIIAKSALGNRYSDKSVKFVICSGLTLVSTQCILHIQVFILSFPFAVKRYIFNISNTILTYLQLLRWIWNWELISRMTLYCYRKIRRNFTGPDKETRQHEPQGESGKVQQLSQHAQWTLRYSESLLDQINLKHFSIKFCQYCYSKVLLMFLAKMWHLQFRKVS